MAVTLRLALGVSEKRAIHVPTGRCRQRSVPAAAHVRAMLAFSKMGVPTFDYGSNIRQMAKRDGGGKAL